MALTRQDLIKDQRCIIDHITSYSLPELFNITNAKYGDKLIKRPRESVDPSNSVQYPPELDDLARLHYLVNNRRVSTILEFGCGFSTLAFCHALQRNYVSRGFEHSIEELNIRKSDLFQVFSVDTSDDWISVCNDFINGSSVNALSNHVSLHSTTCVTGQFNGRVCTFFNDIPNVCPDLIYLDGPHQFACNGDICGISTRHFDRMPMCGDILTFEHFLHPGTLIIIDGRTANARFLKCNLQRAWAYLYVEEWDQHFFELQEEPLGHFNRRYIEYTLGNDYFRRLAQ